MPTGPPHPHTAALCQRWCCPLPQGLREDAQTPGVQGGADAGIGRTQRDGNGAKEEATGRGCAATACLWLSRSSRSGAGRVQSGGSCSPRHLGPRPSLGTAAMSAVAPCLGGNRGRRGRELRPQQGRVTLGTGPAAQRSRSHGDMQGPSGAAECRAWQGAGKGWARPGPVEREEMRGRSGRRGQPLGPHRGFRAGGRNRSRSRPSLFPAPRGPSALVRDGFRTPDPSPRRCTGAGSLSPPVWDSGLSLPRRWPSCLAQRLGPSVPPAVFLLRFLLLVGHVEPLLAADGRPAAWAARATCQCSQTGR
ncbi:collagen alpha-1(III) chain-like [Pteropus medius]|uniref:collagen alpha-1(III) chain-like n=1 Tax=Pteropus vampyrus TaxID=132908 RepID=UPI00196B879F|nr:collagen alpha-1(III) chain-like [Pteropus giganteus]